jgi:hypothetical protein
VIIFLGVFLIPLFVFNYSGSEREDDQLLPDSLQKGVYGSLFAVLGAGNVMGLSHLILRFQMTLLY